MKEERQRQRKNDKERKKQWQRKKEKERKKQWQRKKEKERKKAETERKRLGQRVEHMQGMGSSTCVFIEG